MVLVLVLNLFKSNHNLMWTFIELNLHHLTNSRVQLNKNNVNNHNFNNIARSYQEKTGVTGRLWWLGFCKQNLPMFKKYLVSFISLIFKMHHMMSFSMTILQNKVIDILLQL